MNREHVIREHVILGTPIEVTYFLCPFCEQSFPKRIDANRHMRVCSSAHPHPSWRREGAALEKQT